MTGDESNLDWATVDERADAAVDYLEGVTGLEAIQAYKRQSYELLSPTQKDRILDVGCGLGADVVNLSEQVTPGGVAVGIDRSASLIDDAHTRAGSTNGVRFLVGDAMQLPFDDATFDACRADRVFQHLRHPRGALAEMCRVVRPGGRIAISDPNWDTCVVHAPTLDEEVTRHVTDGTWGSSRNPEIGARLYALVRERGLTDIQIHPLSVVLTDYRTANQALSLVARVERVQDATAVSAARADQWLADVRQAGREGTLFCSMTGYTVAGSVPGE